MRLRRGRTGFAVQAADQIAIVHLQQVVLAILNLLRLGIAQQLLDRIFAGQSIAAKQCHAFAHDVERFGIAIGFARCREVGMRHGRAFGVHRDMPRHRTDRLHLHANAADAKLGELQFRQQRAALFAFVDIGERQLIGSTGEADREMVQISPGMRPHLRVLEFIIIARGECKAARHADIVEESLALHQRALAQLFERLALGHALDVERDDDVTKPKVLPSLSQKPLRL